MKVITEVLKIVLLAAVVILLGMSVGILQKPISSESIFNSTASDKKSIESNQRERDLRKIMEYNLARLFKFPESVKFQNTKFRYERVFHDHGIEVAPGKELEFATLCGQYSAQNAMAVYGPFRPFYGEVAVNNEARGITADLWLKINGKIKKLISLDSVISLDGNEEEFKKLYAKNCGDINIANMGVFSQYKIGYDALAVKYYSKELDKLSKFPEAAESIHKCVTSGASHGYCIGVEQCQRIKELDDDMGKFCSLQKQVCLAGDITSDCESKIEAAYKEKKSTQK